MKFASALGTFKTNHPKFVSFAEYFTKTGLPEDSVIEVTITRPGEEGITTNMKVQQSDIDLISALSELGK